MLPFEPESIESLKARYPEAMKDTYDPNDIKDDPTQSPGKQRKHVFDFEDGLRLIASRDQMKESELDPITHYSVSVVESICNVNQFKDLAAFVGWAIKHINQIRPKEMTGQLITQGTETGIVHMFYDESETIDLKGMVSPPDPRWN